MVDLNQVTTHSGNKQWVKQWIKRFLLRCGLTTKGTCQAAVDFDRHNLGERLGRPVTEIADIFGRMPPERREPVQRILQQFDVGGLPALPVMEKLGLQKELAHITRMDCAEFDIFLHIDSMLEQNIRAYSCGKEPKTVEWLRTSLRAGDVFYDIGANVGAYPLYAVKATQGQVKVVAFEPSFANFYQLCRNILLNGCSASITPLFLPLTKSSKFDMFHYQNAEPGGAFNSFGQTIDYKAETYQPVASINVMGFALDDLSRIPGLPQPNLLKIDVDGLEYDILCGGATTLSQATVREILVELNETTGEATQCIQLLFGYGFMPREKHNLFAQVYNYIFHRVKPLPPAPPAAEAVPCTWRRQPH